MSHQLNLLDLLSATSSQELASGPTLSAAPDGLMTVLYGQDHVLASLSARQAKAQGLMMSGTCGQLSTTSSASAALQLSLVNRLRQKTALVGSTLYTLTWKQRATPGGAVDLCAAGVGAPHIRQRLWWVGTRLADTSVTGLQGRERSGPSGTQGSPSGHGSECGGADGLADASADGCSQFGTDNNGGAEVADGREGCGVPHAARCSEIGDGPQRPGPINGFWESADWLFCRDGKFRPVEPGTSPLAHGSAARVGRLRGYGNAIVAQAAQAFIESVM